MGGREGREGWEGGRVGYIQIHFEVKIYCSGSPSAP